MGSCPTGKCCDDGVCVGITECSGDKCCDGGVCEALEGCESCIGGVATDDKNKCTGECSNCIDAECDDDNALCEPGDVCVDGTCCDTDCYEACSVTDDDVGYDPDDCVSNIAGAGQCTGGWGPFISSYTQSSTHYHAAGPGTVGVDGCADVTYARCKTIVVSLEPGFDCIILPGLLTDNMGTHEECPTE